jgi:mono/diheme cytochrome c family protein
MIMQIRDGEQHMPSFGDELSAQAIEDLVAFLRAKRKVIMVAPKHPETQAQGTGHAASTAN